MPVFLLYLLKFEINPKKAFRDIAKINLLSPKQISSAVSLPHLILPIMQLPHLRKRLPTL